MFTLEQVVPWGRSFEEYRAMFALSDADLEGRVLGCGDGHPMKCTWTIVGMPPSHDYFGQILDADGTVLLCLHQWGAHEHPSLTSPAMR